MSHKVSIIIPCFNEEENIGACLDSIFSINYPENRFEVIIVDNGSVDKTLEIVKLYPVKILENQIKNVSGLRNLGAKKATGDILAFVDADCIVARDWLSAAQDYFDNHDIAAWGSPPIIPENATWVQKAWYIVRQRQEPVQDVDWLESMNLFVRKNRFLEINGFDETLVTCEDVDFSYRVQKYGKIISDAGIIVIHLGEAATVKEFIKKEIWRGAGNLDGLKRHGFSFKELPSLAIPIYFGFLIPLVFIIFIISGESLWFLISLILYLLPSIGAFYKLRKRKALLKERLSLVILLQFYFFSRALAVFKPR